MGDIAYYNQHRDYRRTQTMTSPTNKSMKTIFWEGLAIVLSILLAFAIDAWWQEQAERAEEKEVLNSLTVEFEANMAEAELIISIHDRQIQSVAKLMTLNEQQILALSNDEVANMIGAMANPWGFDAVRGAVDSLVGSGKLGILQNRKLSEALTTFIGMDEAAAQDREILIARSHSVWDQQIRDGGPWWVEQAGLSIAECTSNEESVSTICNQTDPLAYLPQATPRDLLRLRNNSILMGAANQNKGAARMYVGNIRQIQSQINIVLELLAE
jgi:hypothetical protein